MEPSAVCALLCEAAARHTHQAWRWAGAPALRMDRGDTGRILEEGRELRRRDKAEADERSQACRRGRRQW
jgi:hypothetical protein